MFFFGNGCCCKVKPYSPRVNHLVFDVRVCPTDGVSASMSSLPTTGDTDVGGVLDPHVVDRELLTLTCEVEMEQAERVATRDSALTSLEVCSHFFHLKSTLRGRPSSSDCSLDACSIC